MYGKNNEKRRQDWVSNVLLSLPEGSSIIDVGAGECQYKKYCSHLLYTSQDFNQYKGQGNQIGLQTGEWDISQIDIVSDITEIPVPDCTFDFVLCTEVLEHVPDPILALNEMHRILKKGGRMIITAPFCSMTHFAPYHFCDGFNKYFYKYHFDRLGHEILELTPNGNYFEYISQELIRLPIMLKKYNSKVHFLIKLLNLGIVRYLKSHDSPKHKSEDFLCFGYHCISVKK